MENARFSPQIGHIDRMASADLKMQIHRAEAARRDWIFVFQYTNRFSHINS